MRRLAMSVPTGITNHPLLLGHRSASALLGRRQFLGAAIAGLVASTRVIRRAQATENASKGSKDLIALEAEAVGCSAEVYVNDIPQARLLPGVARRSDRPVSESMIDGTNDLAVIINPGPTPSTVRANPQKMTAASPASFSATLKRYPQGVFPGDPSGKLLVKLDWATGEGSEFTAPLEQRTRGALGPLYGPWAWQAARKLDLTATVVGDVTRFLKSLATALGRGDPEPYLQAARVVFEESARAYGKSAEVEMHGFRTDLKEASTHPTWALEPVDPERFDLRLVAGGRLVECLTKDWKPILRQRERSDGTSDWEWPMKLGNLNGQWKML